MFVFLIELKYRTFFSSGLCTVQKKNVFYEIKKTLGTFSAAEMFL